MTKVIDQQRLRLVAPAGREDEIYGTGDITRPLRENKRRGILFPYTPNVSFTTNAEYQTLDLTHVNYVQNFFVKRANITINIDAPFTAQNSNEAHYALAVIHCLTSLTMMRFGASDELRGMPPPILYLFGYGKSIFNGVPVVVESVNVNFDNNSDLVEVVNTYNMDEVLGYVNAVFRLNLILRVQQNPSKTLKEFDLDKFRSGELVLFGYR